MSVQLPRVAAGSALREDAFSEAVASLGTRRSDVIVCVQFAARSAADAADELRGLLAALQTDYVDVLTFYYVESAAEWDALTAANGALGFCRSAQSEGRVRRLGATTHQRPLAADMARSGFLDLLMVRYNAAHRSAEVELFPTTDALGIPMADVGSGCRTASCRRGQLPCYCGCPAMPCGPS